MSADQPLSPAMANLVRALARRAVREHLTQQRQENAAKDDGRTNPVSLPTSHKAA